MNTFSRTIIYQNDKRLYTKGQARIFVKPGTSIERVEEILRLVDPVEYEGYYPSGLVTTFNHHGDNPLAYNHRFDLDIPAFVAACQKEDIQVLVIAENTDKYSDLTTLEAVYPYTRRD